MIEHNRIIKRRLLDGSVQTELSIADIGSDFQKQFVPDGMPLASTGARTWEPDISECFPIALGVIDPRSDIAKNTIEAMEQLWSQAWEDGGYGRYNVLSEPDSPGPWPLATMYMAAAGLEAGDVELGQRAIGWLVDKAGAGGELARVLRRSPYTAAATDGNFSLVVGTVDYVGREASIRCASKRRSVGYSSATWWIFG